MISDEGKLRETLIQVLDRHKEMKSVSPVWLATEAMAALDPSKISPSLVYRAAHLQLRQLARSLCRSEFSPEGEDAPQHSLFPGLQVRYPAAHSAKQEDPEYVRLENLAIEDIAYNVGRLRKEARSKLRHADALEAWAQNRFGPIGNVA